MMSVSPAQARGLRPSVRHGGKLDRVTRNDADACGAGIVYDLPLKTPSTGPSPAAAAPGPGPTSSNGEAHVPAS
jgi:hypothetical protein